MAEDASSVEARLERLSSRVCEVEQRVGRLERRDAGAPVRGAAGTAGPVQPVQATPGAAAAALPLPDFGGLVSLIGRTLFVLAGAFLLRAQTDSGRLDAGLGVLAGLAFATTWIVMTDRAGGQGRTASAAFHGTAFVLIAFPLLFETVTRFHFLNAAAATASLGCATALALAVSWHRRLQGLAWVATLGGLATVVALAIATGTFGPAALFLVLLGVAVLWLGYALKWRLLRWPVAFVADLTVLILSFRAVGVGAADTPYVAFAAQILLLVAYLGSFATRTLVLNRDVIPFEVAQSLAASAVGLGGAAYLMRTTGGGLLPGIAALVLAVGCYGAAAVFVELRQHRRRNYYFYASAGLVLALAGGALALPATTLGLAFALFGVAASFSGRLLSRVTYRAHGVVYLSAAVVVSGLVPHVLYGLGLPVVPSSRPSATMLAVLGLSVVAMWGLGFGPQAAATSHLSRVPRTIVILFVLGGIIGVALGWMLPPAGHPEAPSAGLVATIRTALLVAGILALAVADRFWMFVEGGWLVYPLLALTGLKFVLEDVRAGQPSTLFVSFALYGLALIVGPRRRRRGVAA